MKPRLTGLLLAVASVGVANPAGESAAGRLLDAMGGAAVWATVEAVLVEATHYEMREPTRYANRILNDFTRPRVRFDAHATGWDRWEVIDGEAAWQRRDLEPVQAASVARAADNREWWRRNVYRTLQRLARRDPDLTCALTAEGLLTIHEGEQRLNWFRLNPLGEPVQFGTGEPGVGTVFGPLVEHPSGLRYPAWGASPDGTWRYTIERFVVNPTLSPEDFKLSPPTP